MVFYELMTFLTLLKCFSVATVQLNENILRISFEKKGQCPTEQTLEINDT